LGNFGKIPYGHTIEGRLLFDAVHVQNQYACEPITRSAEDTPTVGESPFILVKKGSCSITQKVRNIEEAGGHVAIIVDDKDENVEELFLADDGHEGDISIPAIIISQTDGNKIINHYMRFKDDKEEIKKIRFEIKFDIENKNNVVDFDIWYTPDIEKVYTFLSDFEKYQNALKNTVKLGIHFVTYPHFMYDANSFTPKEDCLGSGLYCIRPGKLGITDGSVIVLESIRQRCLFDWAEKNEKKEVYSKFMKTFYENCIKVENKFNQICSNDAIYNSGVNIDDINKCLYDSFIGSDAEKQQAQYQKIFKNKILDNEYKLKKEYSISRVPSITINGRLYVGSWRPEFVFEALCAALITKPEACYAEGKFQREVRGFSSVGTFLIIVIVLFINIVLFMVCKDYIRRKVFERIKDIDIDTRIDKVVNSYVALKESKDGP